MRHDTRSFKDADLLWPAATGPDDLSVIETVPLPARGLPATTYDVVARAAHMWPELTALMVLPDASRWREHVDVTFAQLHTLVTRAANALHAAGVRRRDAVALLSPNCLESVAATVAAQTAGIAAPLNPGLSPGHARQLLERSGARVLIAAGPDLDPAAWSAALELARGGALDSLFVLRPTAPHNPPAHLSGVDGVHVEYLADATHGANPDRFAGVLPGAEDLAAFFHTGGTTGSPKLAAHTHANEVNNAWMIAATSDLDADSTVLAALPLFHVNALIVTVLAPLLRGRSVLWAGPDGFRDTALYRTMWKLVEHFGIATVSAVPTVYQTLVQIPVDADISSLRYAITGAAPLPAATRQSFEERTGVRLLEGYGLTEATCATARSFIDHPRPGSVGQRLPYQRVKAVRVDEHGGWTDLAPGQSGVLAISGPTVFAGYLTGRGTGGHALDGLGSLHDGWLNTGDLGRVDDDGFLYLTGRAKDLIIRGGHNIDPTTIEDVLLAHPDVTAAAAVGQPDPHAGEVPVAFVTLSPAATVTPGTLLDWVAEHIHEKAALPKTIRIRDSLPVTDVGKPYKLGLRADAASDQAATALADTPGVIAVEGKVLNGGVSVLVRLADNADAAAEAVVKRRLDALAIPFQTVRGAVDDEICTR